MFASRLGYRGLPNGPAGGVYNETGACCSPATRRTCTPERRAGTQHRCPGCGEPGMEARPGGRAARRPIACSTPITSSGTRLVRACCAPPWRRPRSAAVTSALGALRETMSDLLRAGRASQAYAGMMSGLDIHYDLGEGHPLLGRRMPDLDLVTPAARGGCSACCTMPDRFSRSTSVSPACLDIAPWCGSACAGSTRATKARGTSGAGRGVCAHRGLDPSRRIRRVGGRRRQSGVQRRTNHLVRSPAAV